MLILLNVTRFSYHISLAHTNLNKYFKNIIYYAKNIFSFHVKISKKIKRSILIRTNSTIFRPDFAFGIPPKCACQIVAYLQCIKYTLDCFMYVQSVIIKLGIICFITFAVSVSNDQLIFLLLFVIHKVKIQLMNITNI